jgi:hypothetical protein
MASRYLGQWMTNVFYPESYSIPIKHRASRIRDLSKVLFINATRIDPEVFVMLFDSLFGAEFDPMMSVCP